MTPLFQYTFFTVRNEIGEEGAKVIARGLEQNKSLKVLNCQSALIFTSFTCETTSLDNKFGKGGCAFGDMLKTNGSLTKIDLSGQVACIVL